MAKIKGASKNWFATMELSETEQEQARLLAKRSAAGMLACPLPSCTNKCVSTKVANNSVIDAFGIRFGASIMIANGFAIAILGLNALRHFEQRTFAMCHSRFVAVSRCSILTPAGLQVSSAKPDVPRREPASGHRKRIFRGDLNFVRIFACAVLCLILVHSFMGEKIAMNDGAGWDGLFYRDVSASFTDDILSKGYDSFRLQRVAPFAIENVVYTILDIPRDNDALMIGIIFLHALSILLLLIYFFRLSNLLKWSFSTELIAFSLTFFNFHTLKSIGYEPFQTDSFALTLAFMSFYHFLKNEKWKVVILSVISSFVWPLLGLTGLIMAFFPRDQVTTSTNSATAPLKSHKLFPYCIATAYLLSIAAMALFKYFFSGATHFNEIIFHSSDSVPFIYFAFTSLCTAIFLFLLLRPISIHVPDFIRGLIKRFTVRSAFCFFAIYLCIQAIIHIFANDDFFYSTSGFILQMCIRPLQAPFIFLENHFFYWGLLPLFCMFFWKKIVHEMETSGYGYLTVMAALIIFSLDSESRHSITFLPLLLMPLGTIFNSIHIKPGFAYAVAIFSLFLSRFYYPINVEGIQQAFLKPWTCPFTKRSPHSAIS